MADLDVAVVIAVVCVAGGWLAWKLALQEPRSPPVIVKGPLAKAGKRR